MLTLAREYEQQQSAQRPVLCMTLLSPTRTKIFLFRYLSLQSCFIIFYKQSVSHQAGQSGAGGDNTDQLLRSINLSSDIHSYDYRVCEQGLT